MDDNDTLARLVRETAKESAQTALQEYLAGVPSLIALDEVKSAVSEALTNQGKAAEDERSAAETAASTVDAATMTQRNWAKGNPDALRDIISGKTRVVNILHRGERS
jgi:hypothetical protein